jgi:hypothetical protein
MFSKPLPPILSNIYFWVVFFFLVRLYGITFPPLEVGHNWRQTDGLMIARNFYEGSANIFYPTTDVGGEKTGIVGCEFPVLNYLVFLMAVVFDYDHWYGRLIVLVISSIGTVFFYKLIKPQFGESTAFNATIILTVSLWFSYSRKMIPDTFAASLCIISLFFAFRYLRKGDLGNLFLFFILALLGCLSKILAATILTVLILPILDKHTSLKWKIGIVATGLIIMATICVWYFVWVPYLNTTYEFGDHFSMGMPFLTGAKDMFENFHSVLKRFYATPIKYVGFVIFIASVIYSAREKQWLPFAVFSIPFLFYLILLVKTGANIVGDHYYILTAIPAMAFISGWGLSQINNWRVVVGLLAIIAIENIADQIYDFRIRQPFKALENLESIMDKVSAHDDLIAINADLHNPTAMYFAHRRGWVAPNNFLGEAAYLNEVRNKGCKYVVVVKKLYGDLNLENQIVFESEYFKIYRLSE